MPPGPARRGVRQPHRQLGAARMLFGVREAFVHAATGVECLRVGVFGRVNTAVFLFRIGSSIIDTGPPNRWRAVAEFLDDGPTPTDVFVTHHHEDHAGNAARISARYGARVWAPAAALPLLARPPPVELYRALVWGTPGVGAAETSPYPDAPTVGAERAPLVAVPAPGHSVDHSLLHVPARGALFAADLYVAARPRTARFDEDVVRGLASLRHAAALSDSETLFCAHRGPLDGGARLLREKAAWLGELQSRATELCESLADAGRVSRPAFMQQPFPSPTSCFPAFCYARTCFLAATPPDRCGAWPSDAADDPCTPWARRRTALGVRGRLRTHQSCARPS